MNTAAISERVIGQYPLSIATSLAIEGAMGIHPDKPDQTKKLLPNYEVVWVNLKTIFRNLYNAIDRSVVQDVKPQDFVDAFTSEIDQLKSVIHVETASKTDVVLYVSDYAGMDQKYRHAILRGDQTPLQQQYSKLMVYTIAQYLKTHGHDVKRYTLKITDAEPRRALILTHYALIYLPRACQTCLSWNLTQVPLRTSISGTPSTSMVANWCTFLSEKTCFKSSEIMSTSAR